MNTRRLSRIIRTATGSVIQAIGLEAFPNQNRGYHRVIGEYEHGAQGSEIEIDNQMPWIYYWRQER